MKCENCLNYGVCDDEDKGASICDNYESDRYSTHRYSAPRMSSYERTKAAVYATGNKWAIENFHATHD